MVERMTDLEAETARAALYWRAKFEELWDAVDVFLDAPRRSVAARAELSRVWSGEETET